MANFHTDEWIAVCRLKALLGEPIGIYYHTDWVKNVNQYV